MKLTTEQIKQLIKEELETVLHEAEYLKAERAKCEENFENCVETEKEKIKNIENISGWSREDAKEIAASAIKQCGEDYLQCLENAPAAAVKVMMAKRSKK